MGDYGLRDPPDVLSIAHKSIRNTAWNHVCDDQRISRLHSIDQSE
jgi:hypothetical protein